MAVVSSGVSTDSATYTDAELKAMREAKRNGAAPVCPRCAATMIPREIGGGSFGLGYQRKRDWLLCPRCKRSAMFDRARGTRN
jgi:transposase-like protein